MRGGSKRCVIVDMGIPSSVILVSCRFVFLVRYFRYVFFQLSFMIFVATMSNASALVLVSMRFILTGLPFVGPLPSMPVRASIIVSAGLNSVYRW